MKRVDLQLNTDCNQECVFCVNGGRPLYSFSTAEAKKEIKKAVNKKIDTVAFTGGEPTLRNDLPELISYVKKRNKTTNIILLTNGIRLAEKNYAAGLKEVDIFNLSLHGAQASTNDQLTKVRGSFKKSLAGAKIARDLGYTLVFYYVVTTVNYQEILDFVKLIIKNFPESRGITFAYPYISGRMTEHINLQPKFSKFIPMLLKARDLCQDNDFYFDVASCGLMPLCAVGDLKERILENNRQYSAKTIKTATKSGDEDYVVATSKFQKENFVRSSQCAKCGYKKLCPGVWKSYARIYGTAELKKLKK